AAGHPPLPPIEVALFSKNQPQHWRDAKDVPFFSSEAFRGAPPSVRKGYHLGDVDFQDTRLALVGAVLACGESARLTAARAGGEVKRPSPSPWPGTGLAGRWAETGA